MKINNGKTLGNINKENTLGKFSFCTRFTWTNPSQALFGHFIFTYTWGASIKSLRQFGSGIYSQAISTRHRTISRCPFAPFTINCKVNLIDVMTKHPES